MTFYHGPTLSLRDMIENIQEFGSVPSLTVILYPLVSLQIPLRRYSVDSTGNTSIEGYDIRQPVSTFTEQMFTMGLED